MGVTHLPDSAHVMVDVLEWYLHSIFLKDSTPLEMAIASEQAEALMENFSSQHQIFTASGRVYNRLILSMLVLPICAAPIKSDQHQSNDSRPKISSLFFKSHTNNIAKTKGSKVVDYLIDSTPEDWRRWMEQLEFCRSCLLRLESSQFPPVVDDSKVKRGNDNVNEDLIELPMFRDVYQECLEILECHERLTRFRLALTEERKINNETNVNALVRRYISNPEGEKTTPSLKFFSDAIQNMLRNHVLQKSSPLQSKKLWKLISPRKESSRVRKSAPSSSSLVQTIQSELVRLLIDESSSGYSLFQVQSKVKTLARTWNDSILGIPVLARCGYHYQAETEDMEDTKTLSSFGMEEERDEDTSTADAADESDYHTAEELVEDNRSISTAASSVAVVLNKEQRLQVRPRQSWREDFTMIEDIQKDLKNDSQMNIGGKDDPAKTPKQRNYQNRKKLASSPIVHNDNDYSTNGAAVSATGKSSDDDSVYFNDKDIETREAKKRRRLNARVAQARQKKRQALLKTLDWSSDDDDLTLRKRKIKKHHEIIREETPDTNRRKRAARKSVVTNISRWNNDKSHQVTVKITSSPRVHSEKDCNETNEDTDESSLPPFLRRLSGLSADTSTNTSHAANTQGEDEGITPSNAIVNDILSNAKMGKAKGGKLRAMKKNGGTFCTGKTKEELARIVSKRFGSAWRNEILLLPKESSPQDKDDNYQSNQNPKKRVRLVFLSKLEKEWVEKGVEQYGTGAWEQIVQEAPGGLLETKTPRQCETWYLQQTKRVRTEVDV
mmetsp:Transcript_30146/g.45969  ORF Transcript_30146/g.45969 Transcript_30146/m.45969 type:complete len:781 (-) Transcript_30146:69-2411(-)|eukprot:CAMPEP_0194245640 /NCGR_PEP_ID=MMETSP0158-20130606/13702_1 /TAXON_ID=33649 /ORGANISM="Thalassionema nitzschioides, Strain L26-B" /LENGTH=780 /DNA_ID=CAMNT_0038981387 /DNA_START=207 /DNA_END=2549 /DNA_ORIENTATION=+